MITSSLLKRQSGQYDEAVIQRVNLERQGLNDLRGLVNCQALVDLSLAQNDLTSVGPGLENLIELKRLDLSFNKIGRLEGLEGLALCESLVFLDLRGNRIENIGEVHNLLGLVALRSLYFRGPEGEDANPCCNHASYPDVVLQTLPLLQVLDGAHVKLIEASAQLERQLGSVAADPAACPDVEPESWLDSSADLAALDGEEPVGAQSSAALQKTQKVVDNIETQLKQECAHLLSKASGLIQKAVL